MKYESKNRRKYYLKAHLVFVTKYRKPLFNNKEIDEYIKSILVQISEDNDFSIDNLESDIDHIHMLISYSPNISIFSIVRLLKQIASYNTWIKFEGFLSKYYYRERALFSDGYFVSSIGETNERCINEYIRRQRDR